MTVLRRIPPAALVLVALLLAAAICFVVLAGQDASATPGGVPLPSSDEPVYAVLGTDHGDAVDPAIGTPVQQWLVTAALAVVLLVGHLARRVARR